MSFPRAQFSIKTLVALMAFGFAWNAQALEPYFAEVTATEVNVRSGPSTNYYIVTKLHAGDRVEVRAEDSGWFGIVPTPGCFSLISKHYVDMDGEGRGVVNGNNVRVRAGSNRDPSRYAVQVKLSEGAEVEVISGGPEGFLKIKPPEGAYIWIHGELVARTNANRVAPNPVVNKPVAQEQPIVKQPVVTTRPKTVPTTSRIETKPQPVATNTQQKTVTVQTSTSEDDALLFEGATTTTSAPVTSAVTSRPATTQSTTTERSKMVESTDRVAIYTWTGESGGTIQTTQPGSSGSGKTTAPAVTTTPVPENVSQGIPDSSAEMTTQAAPTTTAPTTTSMSSDGSRSTKRSSQFADDSTNKVAIIRWDDAPATSSQVSTAPVTVTPVESTPPATNAQPMPSTTSNTTTSMNADVRTTQPITSVSPTMTKVDSSRTVTTTQEQIRTAPVQNIAAPVTRVQPKAAPNAVIAYTGSDPRAELKQIDDQLMIEFDKPLNQRDFSELMARYRGIMASDADEAARQYAGRRIHQLEVLSIRLDAVGQMNNLVTTVVQTRESASVQRSTIIAPQPQTMAAIVARGELRESMVFSSPVGPRRYRLIDPNNPVPRTLCYVEIPRDSHIDVSRFLGRIVSVQASRKFIETGNVDPISVLVASSIELSDVGEGVGVSTGGQMIAPVSNKSYTPIEPAYSQGSNQQGSDQIATGRMEPTYGP